MESRRRSNCNDPLHGGREIGPPLYFKILRQLGVSQEEFARLKQAAQTPRGAKFGCSLGGAGRFFFEKWPPHEEREENGDQGQAEERNRRLLLAVGAAEEGGW